MNPAIKEKNPEYARGLGFVMLTWGLFFTWLWPKLFYYKDGNLMAGTVKIWGDFGAHLTYASNFAYKSFLTAINTNPLLFGEPFRYPFVADAITGVLVKMGVEVVLAFVVTSIIFTIYTLFGLYTFFFSQLNNKENAFVAITLIMFSGGIGFYYYLQDLVNGRTDLFFPNTEYTFMGDKYIQFINIVSSELIPQRTILLGIPTTLLILFLLERYKKFDLDIKTFLNIVVLALLSVSLLFIHAHSFIALFVTCVVFLLYNLKNYKFLLAYGGLTAALALLLYTNYFGDNVQSNLQWLPGWYANKKEYDLNIVYFWFLNWGLYLPAAIVGTIWTKQYKNPFVISGFVLFILSNLVLFQAWIWDNTKILTYSYIFLAIPVVLLLNKLITNKEAFIKIIGIILFITLTFSGALEIVYITRIKENSYVMHDKTNLQIADFLNSNINAGDIILTGDSHNNPVLNLTKAQVLMGFEGWLWSYGIDYTAVQQDVYTMYAGGQYARQKLNEYNVSYVFIGPQELSKYRANKSFFDSNYPQIIANPTTYYVYKIK